MAIFLHANDKWKYYEILINAVFLAIGIFIVFKCNVSYIRRKKKKMYKDKYQ